jgi:3-oxoacyl-[acyl-carrier-protein] synthase II
VSEPKIVFTGVGVISPLALNADKHFDRLLAGESAIERLTDAAFANYPPILQAPVKNFDRRQMIVDRMLRKLLAPSPAFALAAASEALQDSGLPAGGLLDCGLYVGSVCLDANPEAFIPALRESLNGSEEVDLARFATHGMKLVDPLFLVKSLPNAGLCAIAIQHRTLGPNANITNGSVSGLQAVIAAAEAIRRGDTDFAVAGGYDSLLRMDCIADHLIGGRLASTANGAGRACRPFDRARSGYAVSEGAAFVVLETEEHARSRFARIYAELASFGQTSLPRALLDPAAADAQPLTMAVKHAMAAANVTPQEIDCVFGDGLATRPGDAREAAAYASLFDGAQPLFTCHTASFGFTGAAAGAFSLVHAMKTFERGMASPVINCDDPDPECRINITRSATACTPRNAVIWNSDQAVKNAALVVKRHGEGNGA